MKNRFTPCEDATLTNQIHPAPGLDGSREWMKRVMTAGGAFTWNVPRWALKPNNSRNRDRWFKIRPDHLQMVKEIVNGLDDYVVPQEKRCMPDGQYNLNYDGVKPQI